ncbi:MAG TPA: rRNA maturation RNase YbeY [Burkholderiales bacterium]|nr:rRNA maturation RNase YbeY [Burkholderiales bacterium]
MTGIETPATRRTARLQLSVQYAVAPRNAPSRAQFRRWVRAALARDARITMRLVGQAEARALNRHFRGKDYATNVLTFVMRDRVPYEGDIALCAPIVAREARAQGKSVTAHYAHLTVHGVLHLQGYDHERRGDAAAMERRESRIVKGFGYPDPYETPAEPSS